MLQGDQLAQLDIASALDVSNSVVVNMLDELEDLGAVRRVRETTDRRRHRIDLTDRGRDLAAKAATIARDLDAELLAPLSKARHLRFGRRWAL
ncbi:MAG: MarR family transcriptional regulator [Actinomycetota bacterium]|nr:MarR family transcriptional regulator [Actinomycetota bacterium]